MEQRVFTANGEYSELDDWFLQEHVHCAMLVCGKSAEKQKINDCLSALSERHGIRIVRFTGFQPNPLYENVLDGIAQFRVENCDAIIAVGGGSAMDVAKCIKLFARMNGDGADGEYLRQTIRPNSIPFLAMPTTAGTGSEATRYAVIYYNGEKQSITDTNCIPDAVLLDASVLKTLPIYQKKATMLDALCHAIESFWSVNSTKESMEYSRKAMELLMASLDSYLANEDEGNAGMLAAANTAGKAINITQTTAGHAMCYKITSLFGCAHGHAAALCVRVLFPWMLAHMDRCVDPRGREHLEEVFDEIAQSMGCKSADAAAEKLKKLFSALEMSIPVATASQFEILKGSVNPVRLRNHPVALDIDTIDFLYHKILNGDMG